MKPTHGLQEKPMDKSFKYNSRQPLVHIDCHQLPKPNMGAPHVLSAIKGNDGVMGIFLKYNIIFMCPKAQTFYDEYLQEAGNSAWSLYIQI